VLEDFIIVDMPKIGDANIILGRPILVTASFHIDVRKGRITFEVEGWYAVFCYMKEKVISPNSSVLDEFPPSPEIDMKDVLNCEDPLDFDRISHEDLNQRYVKVEFVVPMPPNMPRMRPMFLMSLL